LKESPKTEWNWHLKTGKKYQKKWNN
jgi:hypothetical protein